MKSTITLPHWPPLGCRNCPDEFRRPCLAFQRDPGIVGVGCEVVALDEAPGQFERRAVTCYRSPGAMVVMGGEVGVEMGEVMR